MAVISLTTDFGVGSAFVGVLYGVIYGISPDVKIVDISHAIAPQDIQKGALTLWRVYSYFPNNTIHVYVVDPGVGTDRRGIAARLDDHYFVGPDNGLLTPIIEESVRAGKMIEFRHLDNPKYWLPKVSHTFHGRDIFSPVAAHLANGVSLDILGTIINDPVRIKLSHPERTSSGWSAHINEIDIFGNLTLDFPADALGGRTDVLFRLGGVEIKGVIESYGYGPAGDLVAVVDSEDYIELAEVNGSAANRLSAKVGDVVEVILSE
jgi:S-adenosylmethionine hydrolase